MKTVLTILMFVTISQLGSITLGNIRSDVMVPSPVPSETVAQQIAEQAQEAAYKAQEAAVQAEAAAETEYEREFVPHDPWRTHDGETNYIKAVGFEFCGKVLQVADGGVRITGNYGPIFTAHYYSNIEDIDNNSEFFVANYPYTIAEDELISESSHLMAYYVGTYTYTTVQGASRTIRKLDYGIPCDAPQWFIDKEKEIIAANQRAAEIKLERERQKILEGQTNAVRMLLSEATNGDASAQGRLGIHYLNGQGCETNIQTAIYWLQKASIQGDTDSSNILLRLAITNSVSVN